jgi:hypothetical protein
MSQHHRRQGMAAKLRKFRPSIKATLPAPCVQPLCQLGGIVHPHEQWDVGHLPGRDAYLDHGQPLTRNDVGPAHVKCNRSDGGKVGAAMTNRARLVEKRRREW